MIKKNYKKADKNFFIYPNVKSIDQMLCFSLFMALLIFIEQSGQVNLVKGLIFCIAGICVIDVFTRFYRSKNHLKQYASEDTVIFNGSMEELALALYANDFHLKSKVGDFYIFCTKCLILPKYEVVVSVQGNKCLLHAKKGTVVQLCEVINFEDVTADSNQDSKNYGNNMSTKAKIIPAIALLLTVFSMSACSTYPSKFKCGDARGLGCTMLAEVDKQIDSGKIVETYKDKNSCRGNNCSSLEGAAGLRLKSIDKAKNYRSEQNPNKNQLATYDDTDGVLDDEDNLYF